jgi:CheY-like chemotaxis protein
VTLSPDRPELLLLDDVETLLQSMAQVLERLQIGPVHAVKTKREGIKAVDQYGDSLRYVISDWKLREGEDGIAFLKEVKARLPSAECKLLTGYTEELTPEDEASLAMLNIAWLNKMHLVHAEDYVMLVTPGTEQAADEALPLEPGASLTDVVMQQRIQLDEMEASVRAKASAIQQMAADLVAELRGLDPGLRVTDGARDISVSTIATEIERQTPAGLEYIRLDREVRRMLTKRASRRLRIWPWGR